MQKKINKAVVDNMSLNLFGDMDNSLKLRITKKFSDAGKEQAARWICSLQDAEAKLFLANLEKTLRVALTSLGFNCSIP